jgi:hypothetical protein
MKLIKPAALLHVLLDTTSLKGQAQLKRQFCAWVACHDTPITSMFDLPNSDQVALARRFRSWSVSTFEGHIAAFLEAFNKPVAARKPTTTRPVMVSDVAGKQYNAATLTDSQSTTIAAGWLS